VPRGSLNLTTTKIMVWLQSMPCLRCLTHKIYLRSMDTAEARPLRMCPGSQGTEGHDEIIVTGNWYPTLCRLDGNNSRPWNEGFYEHRQCRDAGTVQLSFQTMNQALIGEIMDEKKIFSSAVRIILYSS
jgi:hypothetical protein